MDWINRVDINWANLVVTIFVGMVVGWWSGRGWLRRSIRAGLSHTLVTLKNSTEQLQTCLNDELRENHTRKADLTEQEISHIESTLDSNCQHLERCHRNLLDYIREYDKKYEIPDER